MLGHARLLWIALAYSAGAMGIEQGPLHADAARISGGSASLLSGGDESARIGFLSTVVQMLLLDERPTGTTTIVSIDSAGIQGNARSFNPSPSADGRYVAFQSDATNLVPNDTNGQSDVFIRDRTTGATTRVSVDSAGTQADGSSSLSAQSLSADGRYVTFQSEATNLVSGDTNGVRDVFVHDRTTGVTARVSVDSNQTQVDGFLFCGQVGGCVLFGSSNPTLSADGRYVAFDSWADALVSGDTNGQPDVFVHDRTTGATTRVSVNSTGTQGNDFGSSSPSLSADGRYVAFDSWSTNLVPNDTNEQRDVFVHDRVTGATTRVSVDSAGAQTRCCAGGFSISPSLSAGGRYVAFESWADNLVAGDTNQVADIFVHDRATGVTSRVSVDSGGMQATGSNLLGSSSPSISGDGRYVAFQSDAQNLVPNDSNGAADIFIHDVYTGMTTRASVDSEGRQANSSGSLRRSSPAMSEDGKNVAFDSPASNLVPGDINAASDIFVRTIE